MITRGEPFRMFPAGRETLRSSAVAVPRQKLRGLVYLHAITDKQLCGMGRWNHGITMLQKRLVTSDYYFQLYVVRM